MKTLDEEEGAEVGEVDAGRRGSGNRGLGVPGDAEAGGEEHREIVRAIADREGSTEGKVAGRGELVQGAELVVAITDRFGDEASEHFVVMEENVGAVDVEAEGDGDAGGEVSKTAGDEGGRGAVTAHGGDKGGRAFGKAKGAPGLFERDDGEALEHGDAAAQTFTEVDLAVHAGAGDGRDLFLEAGEGGQLVEGFGGDDGAVHVGKEKLFAPAGGGDRYGVDRRGGESGANGLQVGGRGTRKFDGLAGREDHGRAGGDGFADAREHGVGKGGRAAVRDQDEDVRHRALIVAGPTASGKSALAAMLAERVGGVVINADAMQLYRELRILTARPTEEEEARVPHRFYGVRAAALPASAAWWREVALQEMAQAIEAGRVPVLCGGSGLYLDALLRGLSAMPAVADAARKEARTLLAELGAAGLHARLRAVDPETAARLRPSDSQRLARAWEVWRSTGRGLAEWQEGERARTGWRFAAILLDPPRAELREAIRRRFAGMLAAGALEEVRELLAQGLDPAVPAMRAHGVPELAAYLGGRMTLEEAARRAVLVTGQYAKRQATWFRHHGLAEGRVTRRIHARMLQETKFEEKEIMDFLTFVRKVG